MLCPLFLHIAVAFVIIKWLEKNKILFKRCGVCAAAGR